MAINIQAKTDYSYLFSSFGTANNSGTSNLNFLSNYAAIKNGSYAKLMKAYYNSDSSNDTASKLASNSNQVTATEAEKKSLAKVQTTTDALKESADKLLETGKDSLFAKEEVDTEAIYKAVNSFVTNYNEVIHAADDSGNARIVNKATNMANSTLANINSLNKLGITMHEDGTLSMDKETFMKANMNTAKTLFSGAGSYGYRTSAQASLINFTADNEASKSSIYNFNGTVTNAYGSGNLFTSLL